MVGESTEELALLFSVVIPTFNRPAMLRDAVESVVAQTVDTWECLVVDDAGTVEIEPFDDPRVCLIRREANGGASSAINTGVHHARGRYVTFLADDDAWTPERLEIALLGLERAPLALCQSALLGGDLKSITDPKMPNGSVADTILDSTTPSMATVAVERSRWQDLSEDYRTVEDVEWWLRMAQECEVASVPRVGFLWRVHSGERHMSGDQRRLEDSLKLLNEYEDWFRTHPRAKAFRLRRIGYFAARTGDQPAAVRALVRSFRTRPTLRTARQLALTVLRRAPYAFSPKVSG